MIGASKNVDRLPCSSFGAIQRGIAWPAKVETVVLIVAHRKIAKISPTHRRDPQIAVTGGKDVGGTLLERLVARLKHLEKRPGGDILSQ